MSGEGVVRASIENSNFSTKTNGSTVRKFTFCHTFIMEGEVARKLSGRQSDYNYGLWILNPVN